jgi:cbb3-type cytochrome oxidase subunit 1
MMPVQPMSIEPAKKDIKPPLAIVILGIVIVIVGVIIYAWAISNAVHGFTDTDPNDPFGSMDHFMADASLMMASYAVMAIGGIVFLVGLILLILKMV